MQLVENCSLYCRIVLSGSGMLALLNSIRTSSPSSFQLWTALSFVRLGSEPSKATAQAMASRLIDSYSTAWSPATRSAITPKAVVAALLPAAHGGLTNCRPALQASLLARVGDAAASGDSGADVLVAAQSAVVAELLKKAEKDTATALIRFSRRDRRVLQQVADGTYYTAAELLEVENGAADFAEDGLDYHLGGSSYQLAQLIGCLSEHRAGEEVAALEPPYSSLLQRWLRPNGKLAVSFGGGSGCIELDRTTRHDLAFISEERSAVDAAGLWDRAGNKFLKTLVRNGVGYHDEASEELRVPTSLAEAEAVPAFMALHDIVSRKYMRAVELRSLETDPKKRRLIRLPPKPTLYSFMHPPPTAGGAALSSSAFRTRLGMELLLAVRHSQNHVCDNEAPLVRSGLTAAVIAEAVHKVVKVLKHDSAGCFEMKPSSPELLRTRESP